MHDRKADADWADWARTLLKGGNYSEEELLGFYKEVIHYADRKYYIDNESIITDQEYDQLFAALRDLEEKHPEWVEADSPTQRVPLGLSEKFPTVSHLVPMLSLDNTYNADDLREWDRRCRQQAGIEILEYCVEPKYDGASLSLVYEKGKLIRGVTRGDGTVGEEVTPNVRQIRSIPLTTAMWEKEGIELMEIRGEVVIEKSDFSRMNQARVESGLAPLANPRNAAAGSLRILDQRQAAERRLSAIVYHISEFQVRGNQPPPQAMETHYGSLGWLRDQGFPTPIREMIKLSSIDEVIAYCQQFEEKRDELPFEVDGMVIKVNRLDIQDRLGMTHHHPRWAVAYKFKARQGQSRLIRVEFQVGRTGAITPVAKIEPRAIGGVVISSVSLFNQDLIAQKDLRIGDQVVVERAGDVIPYIVCSLPEHRSGEEQPIEFPTQCPDCSSPLFRLEEEAIWRCLNSRCPAQVVERISHFVSKDAMDIRNLGMTNIQKFYDLGLLPEIPGIYRLDFSLISGLPGFGKKSVDNLQQAIEESKTRPLHRLIFGLGIRHVGAATAKRLSQEVHHLRELYDWEQEKLKVIPDIGDKVAHSIIGFFANPENRAMIDELEKSGVNLENQTPESQGSAGSWDGLNFLFTGTLSQMKRAEAEALVESRGGRILSGVSSKLHYLVAGDAAGSKLEKARKLGTVKILTESGFLDMVNQYPDEGGASQ